MTSDHSNADGNLSASTPAASSILLVEDDAKLAQLVTSYLLQHGYDPIWVSSGADVSARLKQQPIALILLDVNLPGKNGFEICRSIRNEFPGPILMLTARRGEMDHVQGLEIGADDYLCKPIEPLLLLARIRAHLNRQARLHTRSERSSASKLQRFGQLTINTATRQVSLQEQSVHLTNGEYELLAMLVQNAGELVSRERLYEALLNRPYGGVDRAMDGRISQLRRKLGDNPDEPTRILTIWGAGYMFVPDAWQ